MLYKKPSSYYVLGTPLNGSLMATIHRRVFRTLPIIYDGALLQNLLSIESCYLIGSLVDVWKGVNDASDWTHWTS